MTFAPKMLSALAVASLVSAPVAAQTNTRAASSPVTVAVDEDDEGAARVGAATGFKLQWLLILVALLAALAAAAGGGGGSGRSRG